MDVFISFQTEPITPPNAVPPSREIGAQLEFLGLVREQENGRALRGLMYEAYEPMARRRIQAHLDELARIHPCAAVEVIHRTGWVPVGEASIFVRVMSSHRAEALDLMEEFLKRLKDDVPIWKRVQPEIE